MTRWLSRLAAWCPLAVGRNRIALPHRTAVCAQLNALKPLMEPELAAKMTHGPMRRAVVIAVTVWAKTYDRRRAS